MYVTAELKAVNPAPKIVPAAIPGTTIDDTDVFWRE